MYCTFVYLYICIDYSGGSGCGVRACEVGGTLVLGMLCTRCFFFLFLSLHFLLGFGFGGGKGKEKEKGKKRKKKTLTIDGL